MSRQVVIMRAPLFSFDHGGRFLFALFVLCVHAVHSQEHLSPEEDGKCSARLVGFAFFF